MGIFITGDIHGEANRLSQENLKGKYDIQEGDVVIILGDFGLVWNYLGENKREKYWLDWLESKPFTTVFIDGNHECFDRLYAYPVKEWNGGKVHEIRKNVLHLMRGEIFDIQGLKFFSFGGGSSHDIADGILDPDKYAMESDFHTETKRMYREHKSFRIKGVSWWEEELPTREEMENGWQNLAKNDYKVDYILSHSPAASTIALLGGGFYKQDILTEYLEEVKSRVLHKKMFSGHMHVDKYINAETVLLYEKILQIA